MWACVEFEMAQSWVRPQPTSVGGKGFQKEAFACASYAKGKILPGGKAIKLLRHRLPACQQASRLGMTQIQHDQTSIRKGVPGGLLDRDKGLHPGGYSRSGMPPFQALNLRLKGRTMGMVKYPSGVPAR
jgi:hypothetical protein